MSHLHIQKLKKVKQEYLAVRWSVDTRAVNLSNLPVGINESDFRRASTHLEAVYITFLFAEFEAILRDYVESVGIKSHKTEALINRVASRLHVNDLVRDNAQQVREVRNQIMHHGGIGAIALSLTDSAAALSRFLAYLP